jgi:UDP-N-acetylglucosamine diphosphorylase / glucose-1-phosphate thymidylyltransferase / UDP-N-acetylgalactosamine diphosphorylase / glucosamine-1-phosphate N-acetyltransferase / galactosamine-1-phosphate N-acetyltransferase
MKAIILAAGRSKRMKPISDKNFLNFVGKPLIVHQLESLRAAGFEEIIVVGGAHNMAQFEKLRREIDFELVEQEDLDAGMCGAVLSSREKIGDGPVLIFSSNDVVDESAFELIKKASEGEADSYILGKKVDEYFPGGYLDIDDNGLIRGIVEKPGEGNEPSDIINLVLHLHKNPKKLIEKLEQVSSESDDLYEKAMDELIKEGAKFEAVPYEGFWQAIKFPWHVQKVFDYYFGKAEKGVSDEASVADSACVQGEVIIEKGAKIFAGACVNGPAYIGKGAVIGNNALVREASVGENSVIGFGTEVARSFLGNDVWTHSNYVGDSVIGNNVSFGAGAVTGNLRLDEENVHVRHGEGKLDTGSNKFGLICGDNVRFGINASLMPGVKVGADSFVGAGVILAEDVPDGSFVRAKVELKISKNKGKVTKRDSL